jgi:polar amino acid transport system permease protein
MDPDGALSQSIGSVPPPRTRGPRFGIGREGARSLLIALVSTIVFFTVVGWIVVNSPGWPRFQEAFLNGPIFWESLPKLLGKFWVNIRLFLVAEVLILVFGLLLAVLRGLPGPVFFPVRLLATIYVDVFRALPGLLIVIVLGIGIPALRIEGVPTDEFFYAVIALTLVYSAYVSEVYRAGIESIHPSQQAAARSLGLSQLQAMRFVVVPQAVRRVIPPLLNDFIGLQKDTVLVSTIGLVEIFRESQILVAANFNFTPYVATALVFLVVTIPLARFTDWLIARQRRQGKGQVASGRRNGIFFGGRGSAAPSEAQ